MTQHNRSRESSSPSTGWEALVAQCRRDALPAATPPTGCPADIDGLGADAVGPALQARYAPLLAPVQQRPRVVAQLGQSLDGRIATASGHSHYVTGAADPPTCIACGRSATRYWSGPGPWRRIIPV